MEAFVSFKSETTGMSEKKKSQINKIQRSDLKNCVQVFLKCPRRYQECTGWEDECPYKAHSPDFLTGFQSAGFSSFFCISHL